MSESLELELEVEGHYPHCHYVGQIALHQRQSIPFAATDIDMVHMTLVMFMTLHSYLRLCQACIPSCPCSMTTTPWLVIGLFFSPRLPTVMTIASTTWMRRVGITPLLVIAVRTPRLMTTLLLLRVIFQLVPIVVPQLILAIPWSLMVIPIMTITTTSSRPTPSYPLGNHGQRWQHGDYPPSRSRWLHLWPSSPLCHGVRRCLRWPPASGAAPLPFCACPPTTPLSSWPTSLQVLSPSQSSWCYPTSRLAFILFYTPYCNFTVYKP